MLKRTMFKKNNLFTLKKCKISNNIMLKNSLAEYYAFWSIVYTLVFAGFIIYILND